MSLFGRQPAWRALEKLGLASFNAGAGAGVKAAMLAVVMAGLTGSIVLGQEAAAKPPAALIGTVALASLPNEAQETERLIRAGGPFPYEKDGSRFGNRERLLPIQPRGYYREYTVKTPGARDRGARRIVCGGREPVTPDACFYTEDHYASFRRIVQ